VRRARTGADECSGSRQVVRHLQKAIQLRLTSLPQFLCKARRDSSRADQEIGRDVPGGGLGMTARDPCAQAKMAVPRCRAKARRYVKSKEGENYLKSDPSALPSRFKTSG
jgi:hypothetical protein